MSEHIQYELQTLVYFLGTGILLTVIYDGLRVLRRVIPHRPVGIGVQDLIFWTACSIFLFRQIFLKCDGSIRSFAVLGTLLGAIGYHLTISPALVDFFTGILRIPANGVVFLIKRLLFLKKRCRIFVYNQKRNLKRNKRVKSFEKIKKQSRGQKKNPHGNGEYRSGSSDPTGDASVRGAEPSESVKLLPGKGGESDQSD